MNIDCTYYSGDNVWKPGKIIDFDYSHKSFVFAIVVRNDGSIARIAITDIRVTDEEYKK